MNKTPKSCLSFEEWERINSHEICIEYEAIYNEYGDAFNISLSEYKRAKYEEYIRTYRSPPYSFK